MNTYSRNTLLSHRERGGKEGIAVLALSVLGFLDTLYLTVSHYTARSLVCSIVDGCNIVLSSEFSVLFGVPLSLFGLFYYTVLAVLAFLYLVRPSRSILTIALLLASFSLGVSATLLIIQAFIIGAFCLYCITSSLLTLLLTLLLLRIFLKRPQ